MTEPLKEYLDNVGFDIVKHLMKNEERFRLIIMKDIAWSGPLPEDLQEQDFIVLEMAFPNMSKQIKGEGIIVGVMSDEGEINGLIRKEDVVSVYTSEGYPLFMKPYNFKELQERKLNNGGVIYSRSEQDFLQSINKQLSKH
jgi:hypothetical protein